MLAHRLPINTRIRFQNRSARSAWPETWTLLTDVIVMPTFEYLQNFVPTLIKNYICIFSTAPHLPEYEITTTNLTFGLYSGFSINWDAELSYDHVFLDYPPSETLCRLIITSQCPYWNTSGSYDSLMLQCSATGAKTCPVKSKQQRKQKYLIKDYPPFYLLTSLEMKSVTLFGNGSLLRIYENMTSD